MLAFSVPPGYRRSRLPARPKLDPLKQRHTSKRIFERLRDEHGYAGGITIVKDYVLSRRLRHREVFVVARTGWEDSDNQDENPGVAAHA